VDGFLNAFNSKDLDGVMSNVYTNIKWIHIDSVWNHEELKRHLETFFAEASHISVCIDTREVVSDLESYALFAGRLIGSWTDNGGVTRSLPVENIEMQWIRDPNWGITGFSGHAGGEIQFPPVP